MEVREYEQHLAELRNIAKKIDHMEKGLIKEQEKKGKIRSSELG